VSGYQTWRCGPCGMDGVGDAESLNKHIAAHPKVRFWVGTRMLRLAEKMREAGFRLMRAKP
jgi:hypothetical protein